MKRKNILAIISTVAVLAFVSGCTEEDLKVEPVGQLTTENYYSTVGQLTSAVVAAYDPLGWHHQIISNRTWFSPLMINEYRSDNCNMGGGNQSDQPQLQALDDFAETSENGAIESLWQRNYVGIYRCNLIFDNNKVASNPDVDLLLAEARFLRAVYHFELVKLFGPIPIVTQSKSSDAYTRNTLSEVYSFITSELTSAAAVLPVDAAQAGKATKGAALSIAGKAFMYWADMLNDDPALFDSARLVLQQVVDLSKYQLLDYKALFNHDGNNTAEGVFEIQHTGRPPSEWTLDGTSDGFYSSKEGAAFIKLTGIRGLCSHPLYQEGWSALYPTASLFNYYLEDDTLRRDATITSVDRLNSECTSGSMDVSPSTQNPHDFEGYWQIKYAYFQEYSNRTDGDDAISIDRNVFYIRYSDVLLLLAEAHLRGANVDEASAKDLINQVRNRGNSNGDAPRKVDELIAGESRFSSVLDVLRYERRIELALEGDRWSDMVRTANNSEDIKNAYDPIVETFHGDFRQDPNPRVANFDMEKSTWLPIPSSDHGVFNENEIYPEVALFK